MFRQTNIFWVAVLPAGLLAVDGIAEKRISSRDMVARSQTFSGELQALLQKSWKDGVLYDPQVRGAWSDGKFAQSAQKTTEHLL